MLRVLKRLGLVFAFAGMAGACVSVLPEPDTPGALYRFGPVAPVSGLTFESSVLVRQPEAPRVLAGVEIAARDARGAVRVLEGVEWADRAPRLLQLTMLDMLNGDGGGHALLPESGAVARYQLSWRLTEFSLQGEVATASIEYILVDAKTRKPLAQDLARVDVTATGDSAGERAEAMAEAARAALEEGARFVVDAISPERDDAF